MFVHAGRNAVFFIKIAASPIKLQARELVHEILVLFLGGEMTMTSHEINRQRTSYLSQPPR
jgi:hypothetical protein